VHPQVVPVQVLPRAVPDPAHHPAGLTLVQALVQVPLQAVPDLAPVLLLAARAQVPVPAHPQAVQALAPAPVLQAARAQALAQVHPQAVQARAQVPAQAKWLIR
jgi:hypothetical protein